MSDINTTNGVLTLSDDPVIGTVTFSNNQAPTPQQDSASVYEFGTIDNIDVLSNDSDPEGDNLTIISAVANNGSAYVTEFNTINYTAGSAGIDTITYTVQDVFGNTAQSFVIVDVLGDTGGGGGDGGGGFNNAPVTSDDYATTDEFTSVTVDVVANDYDIDGDPLTLEGVYLQQGEGEISVVGNNITVTPFVGAGAQEIVVGYNVTDGISSSSATLNVTVSPSGGGNIPPEAIDDYAITGVNQPVTIDVLANDYDLDGDTLSLYQVYVSPEVGQVVVNENSTITFIPNEGFIGQAQIEYSIQDSSGMSPSVAFLYVNVQIQSGQFLQGTDGDDSLVGTLGADTIFGGGGNDIVIGEDNTGNINDGDDVLVGGTGNDFLAGSSGNDTYIFNLGDGQDQINNYDPNQTVSGVQSYDRLIFGVGINPSDIQVSTGYHPMMGAEQLTFSIVGTNDSISIFGFFRGNTASLTNAMVDAIEFADGTVWTKEQILSGLNPVENQIIGDDGNNLLVDTDANDHIQGLAGNDTLVGSHGNDLLEGGDGDDVLVEQSSQIFLQDLSQLYNSSLVNNLGGTQGFGENSIALGDDNLEQIDISAIFGQSGGFTAQISTNGTIFLNGIQGSTNITIYGRDLDTRTREGLLPTAGGNSTGSNTVYYDIDTANGILTVTWDDVAIYGYDTSILNAFQLQIIRQGDAGDYDVVLRYEDVQEGYINIGFNGQPIQSPVDLQTTGQGVYGFKVRNGLIHSSLGDNNTLVGGQGYDMLVGGDGNDTYVFNLGDGQDVIDNSPVDIFNQNGFDRLVFGVGINPSDIELRGNGVDLILAIKDTLDSVTLVGALANVASGLDAIEFADGTVWDRWQIEQMPLMVVGNGNNILNGMSGNDTLTGSATNDLLIANAGNDILIGGLGSDTLNGGSGSDTYIFNLGDGSDVLADYDGNQQDYNRLVFGVGINPADIELSSSPSDSRHLVISVKGTNDSITIQNYFDNQEVYGLDAIEFADGTIWTAQQIASMALVVIGNNNNNYLYGTDGNDLMQGLGGDDYLFGNNGNDTMDGGIGHDVLYGGFGNDSLYGGDASQEMSIIGYQEVITGYQDVLVGYQDVIIGYQDVLVGYQDVIVGYQEVYLHDELVITGYEEVIIDYDIHGQPIYETRPIEVWQPVYVTEPIYQQEPIYQSEPIYSQEPVYENQPIYGQEPIYDLVTVGGNDELYGDFGNDILNGGAGQDFISGGDSDDTLIGGLGNDHLQGDNGNDTYVFNLGDGQDSIYNFDSAEVNNAITSYDRLVFGMGINPADIQFSINPNNGNHLLISIAGTTDSILIQNYFANPSIFALDAIEFADGTIWSSSQIASMVSPLLHLVGDNNDNSLEGTNTHDLIEGLGGDDYLYANDGDDTLIGGTGNDYLTGNLGSDTYIFNLGDGQDMIYQWNGGDQSYDRLVFGAGINANDIEMRRNINDGNDLVIAIKGTADFISLRSYYNDPLYYGLDAIEFADGTVWTATQVADLAANISLVGTDDTNGIYGSSTHDVLMGLGANDYLNGYEGDDTLIGGTGNDYLIGNLGSDAYIFNLGDGQDTISQYEYYGNPYNDRLVFGEGINASEIVFYRDSYDGRNLIITIKGSTDSITVLQYYDDQTFYGLDAIEFADGTVWTATQIADLAATVGLVGDNNNNWIYGSASNEVISGLGGEDNIVAREGNDTLIGGEGNDSLTGDQGSDTYIFNLGDGQDTVFNYDANSQDNDRLVFGAGISQNDINLHVSGSDLIVAIKGTTDSVNIVGYFSSQADYALNAIEFADGTVWTAADIYDRLITNNAAPVAVDDIADASVMITHYEDGTPDNIISNGIYINVLENDSDVNGDFLTVGILSVTGGTAVVNYDRTISYFADGTQTQGQIRYQIADGLGGTSEATVNVNIDIIEKLEYTVIVPTEQPFEFNPIENDYGYAQGDPHMYTFDGVAYEFQAVGEFTFVQGDGYEVQIRTEAINNRVSGVTATAMKFGDDVVGIYSKAANRLVINGAAVELASGVSIKVGTGYVSRQGDTYEINDGAGHLVLVDSTAGYDFVRMPVPKNQSVTGLLGNANDSHNDEFILRDGTQLDSNIPESTIYTTFANSWRVDNSTSLFVYGAGESTATYTNLNFPVDGVGNGDWRQDFEPNIVAWAEQIALGYGLARGTVVFENAVLDIVVSGNTEIIQQTLQIAQELTEAGVELIVNQQMPPMQTGTLATLANGLEDTTYTLFASDLLQGYTDVNGDVLSVINLQATNGALSDNQNGTYTFTPDANFYGTVNLNYQVSDGHNGIVDVVNSFILDEVNDAPIAGAFTPLEMGTEDIVYAFTANDLLQGFSDVDGDVLSIINLQATNGVLTDNQNGTYSFTPDANFNGTVDLSYQVIDGRGGIANAVNSFVLNAVNDLPVLTGTQAILNHGTEDTAYILSANDLLQGFSDVDGDHLNIINLQVNDGVLSDNQNGTYTFTPDANFNGTVNISYQIHDSRGGMVEAANSFEVDAVNDAPTGSATAVLPNVTKGSPTKYTVSASQLLQGFSDIEGDSLMVVNVGANGAQVVNNNDGTYTFTVDNNREGQILVTYEVSDSGQHNLGATQAFTVVVDTVGTSGADVLVGGDGASNDTYIVNHIRDVVLEHNENGGIDTVQSSLSYNLGNNLENLVLVGSANLSGTGNNLDNMLQGNDGKNRLLAGDGNDSIYGGAGADTINGGTGADVMYGGTGNDTFTVENPNDLVIEFANEGYDTINSFVTYTLAANVERLNLENAGGQINAFGNDLDNTLNGNNFANYLLGGAGNDSLQGKAGADTLEGGLGDDVYYVDDIGDVVTELAGEGTDKVNSTVSYSLTANIEQLFLTGIASLSGTGNAQNNIIYGNSGNNLLSGGAGNDSLNGGAGNDTLDGGQGNDTLVGSLGNDTYLLGVGSGRDTIDNKDSVGNDVLLLGTGVTAEQVWLRQLGNDLEVSIIGTNNSAKVKGWYSGDVASKIDSVQLADGRSLLANEVQTLVDAMATFAPPTTGQTTLSTEQQNALGAVITASW